MLFELLCLFFIFVMYSLLIYGLFPLIAQSPSFKPNTCFLIVGAAKGLGREVITQLSKLGGSFKFVLLDILPCEGLVREITSRGHIAVYHKVDLRDTHDLQSVLDKICNESFPDILICNAAKINAKPIHELTLNEIQETFTVNTISHAFIMSRLLPLMYKRNAGHIVTIASIASFVSGANNADYAGSKFALRGWHEAMRMEIKKRKKDGIHTSIVHPYIINTELFKGISSKLSLLFPIQDVRTVAKKVIAAIYQKEEEIFVPWYIRYLPTFYYLSPIWIRDPANSWQISMDMVPPKGVAK